MNSNLAYQEEAWEELTGGEIVAKEDPFNHNRAAVRIAHLLP